MEISFNIVYIFIFFPTCQVTLRSYINNPWNITLIIIWYGLASIYQGVTNCCQISYTLPEIPFEISEITEILKSEIKESWNSNQ